MVRSASALIYFRAGQDYCRAMLFVVVDFPLLLLFVCVALLQEALLLS